MASNAQTVIDARPTAASNDHDHGIERLRDAGYMSEPRTDERSLGPELTVKYQFSQRPQRIAYFEVNRDHLDDTRLTDIVRELLRRTRLKYFWFIDTLDDSVHVFRSISGIDRFTYNPRTHVGDTRDSKLEKLSDIDDDLGVLFDKKDLVNRFYDELWDHRTRLANSLETRSGHSIPEQERLLTAQRIIDRLIFTYFLVERDIVVAADEQKRVRETNTPEVFETLVRQHDDFAAYLQDAFFNYLNSPESDWISFANRYTLYLPYLNGELFQPADIETASGEVVREDQELVIEDYDWAALIDQLNQYNWMLDGLDTSDAADEDIGVLTPAVLGHIYEKFVITISQVGDDIELTSLSAAERDDVLDAGNQEVGAYYTGDEITDFMSRRGLWDAARDRIEDDLDAGKAPQQLGVDDLYQPAFERREDIESQDDTGFDVLYDAYQDDATVLDYIDDVLTELTVCDPAVGSGSFALSVANTLFEWRMRCQPDRDAEQLRRDIIANNVFGADILEGATEICKLRLWLWLIGGLDIDVSESQRFDGHDGLTPLPDIGFNIRTGNSLLGFTEPRALAGEQASLGSTEMTQNLVDWGEDVDAHRGDPNATREDRKRLEDRHDDLKSELDDRYAEIQLDDDNDPVTFEHSVESAEEAVASINQAPRDCRLVIDSGSTELPNALSTSLDERGFTTYKYRATTRSPPTSEVAIRSLIGKVTDAFGGTLGEDWELIIGRAYTGYDFREDRLNACHWVLEFPLVFDIANAGASENSGFDLIISNPPYGAEISTGEKNILKSETHYYCQGAGDTYEWFYERVFDLARTDGVISFIVNQSNITYYKNGTDIREKVLDESTLSHIFDVGKGFVGVNLETIAIVHSLSTEHRDDALPTIHQTKNPKRPTINTPEHRGWFPQSEMRDSDVIVFAPVSESQQRALDNITDRDHRLGDLVTRDAFRELELWVKEDEKDDELDPGDDHFLGRGPYIQEFTLEDTWHVGLSAYRSEISEYTVPRVIMKSMRGTRLRTWIDERGEIVSNGKTVGAPLEDSDRNTIAFVYAALNHPAASFYLQKAIFSETTETARVMDSQYSHTIPIPNPTDRETTAVATLARAVTMVRQLETDGVSVSGGESSRLQRGLEALVGSLYLDIETASRDEWVTSLLTSVDADEIADIFSAFYTARFADASGTPSRHYSRIQSLSQAVDRAVQKWNVDPAAVLDHELMNAVDEGIRNE